MFAGITKQNQNLRKVLWSLLLYLMWLKQVFNGYDLCWIRNQGPKVVVCWCDHQVTSMLYIFEVYVYVNPPPRVRNLPSSKVGWNSEIWAIFGKSNTSGGWSPRGSDPNQTWLVVFPPLGFKAKFTPLPEKKRCKWEDWGPRQVGLSRTAHFVEVSWLWLFECAWCSEFIVYINNTKHQERGILILLKQQCYYLNWFRGTQPHCFFFWLGRSKKPH